MELTDILNSNPGIVPTSALRVGNTPTTVARGDEPRFFTASHGMQEGIVTRFNSLAALTDHFDTTHENAQAYSGWTLDSLGRLHCVGNASFAYWLDLPLPFVREDWTARIMYTIEGPTAIGPALQIRGINPYATYSTYSFSLVSTATGQTGSGYLEAIIGNGSGNPPTLVPDNMTAFAIASGDMLELTVIRRGLTLTWQARNLTQGGFKQNQITCDLAGSATFPFPNTSLLGLNSRGGPFTIHSFEYISDCLLAPDLLCIGDSKTFGAKATLGGRWATRASVANGYTLRVEAGGGDRTVEAVQTIPLLRVAPKIVIIALGHNDRASGVPDATWQANYQTITNTAKAWGAQVFHLLPIPETAIDQSSLRAFVLANYPGRTIDPSVGWSNSTMLDADGVHPNPLGHQFVGGIVAAYLAAQTT